MEIFITTTQKLSTFDIFSLDGQLYQVIGHSADTHICEAIDYDDDAAAMAVDLDTDAITYFDSTDA